MLERWILGKLTKNGRIFYWVGLLALSAIVLLLYATGNRGSRMDYLIALPVGMLVWMGLSLALFRQKPQA